MIFKGVLLAGVALATMGFITDANAAERLSMYEIKTFVSQYTNAVNSPATEVGSRFLEKRVATSATFQDNLITAWGTNTYYQAWNNYDYVSPNYRYPHYAYNNYVNPTSVQSTGKAQKIDLFEHKKSVIPRYHQTMDVLGANLSMDATAAVIDVRLREFGLSYNLAPYNYHYGQNYTHKIQHSDARCNMHLSKKNGNVMVTKMVCNKVQHAPI